MPREDRRVQPVRVQRRGGRERGVHQRGREDAVQRAVEREPDLVLLRVRERLPSTLAEHDRANRAPHDADAAVRQRDGAHQEDERLGLGVHVMYSRGSHRGRCISPGSGPRESVCAELDVQRHPCK